VWGVRGRWRSIGKVVRYMHIYLSSSARMSGALLAMSTPIASHAVNCMKYIPTTQTAHLGYAWPLAADDTQSRRIIQINETHLDAYTQSHPATSPHPSPKRTPIPTHSRPITKLTNQTHRPSPPNHLPDQSLTPPCQTRLRTSFQPPERVHECQ